MSEVISIRINETDKARLEAIARATGTSRSSLVAEAIRGYLDVNEYQTALILSRIKLADKGEFASQERVKAAFAKWGVDADHLA
jgi:RHH-type rel operon transcriptional repressor/antitoxin RelB